MGAYNFKKFLFQNSEEQGNLSSLVKAGSPKKLARQAFLEEMTGGERGIRTLVPGFPGSCLAGKRFRPLSHLSF